MKKLNHYLPLLIPAILMAMAISFHSQPITATTDRTVMNADDDDDKDDKPKDPKRIFEWRIAWGPKPETQQAYDDVLVYYGE